MCASKMKPRHCEPVRTLANPPDFQDTIIEQLPLFSAFMEEPGLFWLTGRSGGLPHQRARWFAMTCSILVR